MMYLTADVQEPALRETRRLLRTQGYKVGEYNPHGITAYHVGNEYGVLGMAIGSGLQDALDWAADNGLLDGEKMSDADYEEYAREGWDDSYVLLGNASEAFWCERLWVREVLTA